MQDNLFCIQQKEQQQQQQQLNKLVPNCPLPAHVNRLSHRFNFAKSKTAAAAHQYLIYKRNHAICICLFWWLCFVFGTSSTAKVIPAQWD